MWYFFVWSMLEGEMGLIMAGLMAHDGSMNLFLAIFIAGLGGFAGDQVYIFILVDSIKREF